MTYLHYLILGVGLLLASGFLLWEQWRLIDRENWRQRTLTWLNKR